MENSSSIQKTIAPEQMAIIREYLPAELAYVPNLKQLPTNLLPQMLLALVVVGWADTWKKADILAEMRRRLSPDDYEQHTSFVSSAQWRDRLADLADEYPRGEDRIMGISPSHYYELRRLPEPEKAKAIEVILEKKLNIHETRNLRNQMLDSLGVERRAYVPKHETTILTAEPESVLDEVRGLLRTLEPGRIYEWTIKVSPMR